MSSQADSGIGENAVMCYFPELPYYLRYQIGFDIIINPPEAQADPSVAGESHRLIHVELFFPDGFMCNPATFDGMPHPRAFGRGAPHFFARHHHFYSSMYQDFPHLTPHFDHLLPPVFEGPMMWPEQHCRVSVCVRNGQLGEFMAIDGTPYDFIPQCNICGEFHREPGHSQNQPSRFPRNTPSQTPHDQPEHSRQHSSASGITGQRDTSHASPCAPHFFPARPPFYPPMYADSPHVNSHFDHHIPMGFEAPQIWEEQHHTRVFEVFRNGQPGEFMVNEDTPRFNIPQFNMRGEVPRQPGHTHDNPSEYMPSQQPRKKSRHSSQHPSTSGITGQRGTLHASPRTPRECVSTDYKGHLLNEDKSYLTQPTEEEIQIMLPKSVQEIQPKNYTATSADNQPTADVITRLMNLLDVDLDDEKNEENMPKDNKKPSDDPDVNSNN